MKKIFLLILPLFLLFSSCKKEYAVERSITIEAPTDVVWQQVKYFQNWKNWSPWYAKDSSMAWTFTGTDGEPESTYAWTSEESGSGEMTNTGVTEGEEILYHTHFMEPWDSESDGYIRLKEVEGGTEVVWGFYGVNKGVSSLFLNMDEMVGPDFEKGLDYLKEHSKKMAKETPKIEVETIDYPGKDFMAVREEIDVTGIQSFFATNFGYIMDNGVQMEGGYPSGIYYTWDIENMKSDMAAAIPVAKGTKAIEGASIISLPASKALLINYYGPYEGVGVAHEMMETYMENNKLEYLGPAIEEYVSDPTSDSNPNEWLTKVIYLIK